MKRKNAKYMLAGGLAVSSSLLLGCFHQPVPLYGPPPDTSFTPEINIPEAVYGPPPDLDLNEWYSEDWDDATTAPSFDPPFTPEANIPEDVYAPPQDFGFDEDPDEEDMTPAPSFDPADNLPAPVYGPPEGF